MSSIYPSLLDQLWYIWSSQPSLFKALGLVLTALVFLISVVIYRLTLHPLAKYPGPFLHKISVLPCIWHAWRGDRHLVLHELHKKHGDVVRYGPNILTFNTPRAIKDIYGPSSKFCKAKYYSLGPPGHQYVANIVSAVDKQQHGRKRRLMSQALSDSVLGKYEPHVINNISIFCQEIASPKSFGGAVKNLSKWFDYLTYDIMGNLAFGKSYGMLKSDEHHFVQPLIDTFQHRGSLLGTEPMVKKFRLENILYGSVMEKQLRFQHYAEKQAVERMTMEQSGNGVDDIFRLLMDAKDPQTGEKMSLEEISGEAAVLIVAGSDTSSTALSGLAHYLAAYPECFAKLKKEVRNKFVDVDSIRSGQQLASCSYLRACIDEALRMTPPVPGFLPRENHGGGYVDGVYIPPGVEVGVPIWTIHRRPSLFPDPTTFRPERWIEDPPEQIELARSGFIPFSLGSRGCVGKGLALMELYLVVARFAYIFRLEVTEKLAHEYPLDDHFGAHRDGPYLKVVAE